MADLLRDEAGLSARAATLGERLGALGLDATAEVEPSFATSLRLARWRAAAAGGDVGRFAAILRQRGIELGSAQRALSEEAYPGAASAAPWVQDLRTWLDAAAAAARGPPPDWVSPSGPPAAEFLWPLVVACEDRLSMRSAAPMLRTPAIRQAMQAMLARWIGNIAASAVAEQRATGRPLDLGGLMATYPVLARLLATVAESWSAAMVEFAERCEADRDLLAQAFAGGAPLGPPVAVALDLSDPHNDLRTVAVVTFASGLRLVYKPRSLAMDAAFAAFLDALNATGQLPDLRAPRTLQRPGYGWCEWIEDRAPADAAEWAALCARTGALLAIVFLLEGVDIHDENIVFTGGHPVIVDAETMLHPRYWLVPVPAKLEAGLATAWRGLQLSVRRTLMVSEWHRSEGIWRDSAAISALAARWLAAGLIRRSSSRGSRPASRRPCDPWRISARTRQPSTGCWHRSHPAGLVSCSARPAATRTSSFNHCRPSACGTGSSGPSCWSGWRQTWLSRKAPACHRPCSMPSLRRLRRATSPTPPGPSTRTRSKASPASPGPLPCGRPKETWPRPSD